MSSDPKSTEEGEKISSVSSSKNRTPSENFQSFYDATTFSEAAESFSNVLNAFQLKPGPFGAFFPQLKNQLHTTLPYKYQQLWDILEKRSKSKVYGKQVAKSYNVSVAQNPKNQQHTQTRSRE